MSFFLLFPLGRCNELHGRGHRQSADPLHAGVQSPAEVLPPGPGIPLMLIQRELRQLSPSPIIGTRKLVDHKRHENLAMALVNQQIAREIMAMNIDSNQTQGVHSVHVANVGRPHVAKVVLDSIGSIGRHISSMGQQMFRGKNRTTVSKDIRANLDSTEDRAPHVDNSNSTSANDTSLSGTTANAEFQAHESPGLERIADKVVSTTISKEEQPQERQQQEGTNGTQAQRSTLQYGAPQPAVQRVQQTESEMYSAVHGVVEQLQQLKRQHLTGREQLQLQQQRNQEEIHSRRKKNHAIAVANLKIAMEVEKLRTEADSMRGQAQVLWKESQTMKAQLRSTLAGLSQARHILLSARRDPQSGGNEPQIRKADAGHTSEEDIQERRTVSTGVSLLSLGSTHDMFPDDVFEKLARELNNVTLQDQADQVAVHVAFRKTLGMVDRHFQSLVKEQQTLNSTQEHLRQAHGQLERALSHLVSKHKYLSTRLLSLRAFLAHLGKTVTGKDLINYNVKDIIDFASRSSASRQGARGTRLRKFPRWQTRLARVNTTAGPISFIAEGIQPQIARSGFDQQHTSDNVDAGGLEGVSGLTTTRHDAVVNSITWRSHKKATPRARTDQRDTPRDVFPTNRWANRVMEAFGEQPEPVDDDYYSLDDELGVREDLDEFSKVSSHLQQKLDEAREKTKNSMSRMKKLEEAFRDQIEMGTHSDDQGVAHAAIQDPSLGEADLTEDTETSEDNTSNAVPTDLGLERERSYIDNTSDGSDVIVKQSQSPQGVSDRYSVEIAAEVAATALAKHVGAASLTNANERRSNLVSGNAVSLLGHSQKDALLQNFSNQHQGPHWVSEAGDPAHRVEATNGSPAAAGDRSDPGSSMAEQVRTLGERVSSMELDGRVRLEAHRLALEQTLQAMQHEDDELESQSSHTATEVEHIIQTNKDQRRKAFLVQEDIDALAAYIQNLQENLTTAVEFARSVSKSMLQASDSKLAVLKELSDEDERKAKALSSRHRLNAIASAGGDLALVQTDALTEAKDLIDDVDTVIETMAREQNRSEVELTRQYQARVDRETMRHAELLARSAEINRSKVVAKSIEDKLRTAVGFLEGRRDLLGERARALAVHAQRLGVRPLPVPRLSITQQATTSLGFPAEQEASAKGNQEPDLMAEEQLEAIDVSEANASTLTRRASHWLSSVFR